MQDKSYSLVNSCIEIKKVEQGIPIDPFLLLKGPSQVTDDSLYKDSLANFLMQIEKRKPKIEHSILNRLNCHKDKFDELYKVFSQPFQDKNRYPDMLPFKFNRVKLDT